MQRTVNAFSWPLFITLLLIAGLSTSCQEEMDIKTNDEMERREIVDTEEIQALTRPDTRINCESILPGGEPPIEWSFACTGEGDVGACTASEPVMDAGELLEEYLNCLTPNIAIPLGYHIEEVTTIPIQYYEGDVEEKCGIYNPWNFLGFDNNCSVTVSDLSALGDYLFSINETVAPNTPGVFLDKVHVYWTAWNECSFNQTFNFHDCTRRQNPMIYDCGAAFWAGSPDCSFCKDVCEYRALAVGFQYGRLVYTNGPG